MRGKRAKVLRDPESNRRPGRRQGGMLTDEAKKVDEHTKRKGMIRSALFGGGKKSEPPHERSKRRGDGYDDLRLAEAEQKRARRCQGRLGR